MFVMKSERDETESLTMRNVVNKHEAMCSVELVFIFKKILCARMRGISNPSFGFAWTVAPLIPKKKKEQKSNHLHV